MENSSKTIRQANRSGDTMGYVFGRIRLETVKILDNFFGYYHSIEVELGEVQQ